MLGTAFPVAATLILGAYTVFHYRCENGTIFLHAAGIGSLIGAGLTAIPGLAIIIQQVQIGSPVLSGDILVSESAVGGALTGTVAGHLYGLTILEQRELEAQRDELHRHRQRFSVLNRILRHDIRNHVNVIVGNAQLLPGSKYDTEIKATIETHGQKIIDISRNARQIESTLRVDGDYAVTELQQIVSDAVDTTTVDRPDGAVDIQLEESGEVRSSGHLDSAVRNVVENAIEYNDSNNPHVTISAVTEAASNTVVLEIADNGPGILETKQQLFNNEKDQLEHSLVIPRQLLRGIRMGWCWG